MSPLTIFHLTWLSLFSTILSNHLTAKSLHITITVQLSIKTSLLNPVTGDSNDFVLWKIANDFLLVKYNGIFCYLPTQPPPQPPASGGSSRNTANHQHFHSFISIL